MSRWVITIFLHSIIREIIVTYPKAWGNTKQIQKFNKMTNLVLQYIWRVMSSIHSLKNNFFFVHLYFSFSLFFTHNISVLFGCSRVKLDWVCAQPVFDLTWLGGAAINPLLIKRLVESSGSDL